MKQKDIDGYNAEDGGEKNRSSTYCRMLSIETLVKQCIKANREKQYNRHFKSTVKKMEKRNTNNK